MNKIHSIILFAVAAFAACFGWMRSAATATEAPPTNNATRQFEHIKSIFAEIAYLAGLQLRQFGELVFGKTSLRAFIVPEKTLDEQIKDSLAHMSKRFDQLEEMQKGVAKNREDLEAVTKLVAEVAKDILNVRKISLEQKDVAVRRPGQLSDGAAKYLGTLWMVSALKTPGVDLKPHQVELAHKHIKDILGLEAKAALTSADIPLPVQYSAEIVEFVYEYGLARKVGTVFPLGAASVKLPKLTTDPTFGLIATSGSVPEKSPQIAFVTFTAEKFGGLIRLPEEIDEDSIIGMGQFIARYAARNIAYVEDWQFFMSTGAASGINGTGPGLVTAVVTDACYVYNGNLSTSGKTKPSDATLTDFRNMRNASTLSGIVLGKAKYYMHPTYEALLVSFNTSATVTPYKAGTGNSPATLDGFEIVWVPVMPVYSTSATVSVVHALFGDVSYQYLGLRNGIRFDTSRDAAFATDEILIRALERLTVALMASKAIAGLRCSAS